MRQTYIFSAFLNLPRKGPGWFVIPLLVFGCTPTPEPEDIPLPTQICVRTVHHFQPIPNAVVYVKYNTVNFPGYDQPASYYDTKFETDANARGCLAPVPEGTHWLVAFGYDSLYYPHHVFGAVKLSISLNQRPKVDTILYVSE
jgi:hypothetical protein